MTNNTLFEIILIALIVILYCKHLILVFKVGYYEQTLKNNQHKFDSQRFDHIKKVMRINTLIKLLKHK